MDPGDELVDVIDETDHVIDIVPRREIRSRNLLHRCTYAFVLDPVGRLYVHQRTDTKDVYPGYFDVVAGGVNLSGEASDDCAARELEEELGVSAAPRFRFLQRWEGESGRVLGAVYDVVWDGPMRLQADEVAWGSFVPMDEVDGMIRRERFCPDGLAMFERWRGDGGARLDPGAS